MLTRKVRVQVVAFVLIALVGVSYVGARYAGLGGMFGNSGYTVTVRLADSGGIFTHAEVTYRGVGIGRVGKLQLTDAGVEVELLIRPDAPSVPEEVDAVVANRSAVGEQYVDLRPRRDGSPFLADGSVIQQRNTALPLPTETLLLNLDKLVTSVPTDELRNVVDELYDATLETGPHLQALLDSAASFTDKAVTHLPQTTTLITDAGVMLARQVENGESIKSFSVNMKLIAEQLKASDGDIRTLLGSAPAVALQVSELIKEIGGATGILLANLLTTSNVLQTRQGNLEQLLVITPQAVAAGRQVIRSDGAHFGLASTFFAPLPCVTGYNTKYRNGLDTGPGQFNTQARCALAPSTGVGVRGSQNAPGSGAVPPASKPGR
ncbi:phospholipid/cholesterol/gamma-HCH transport system substrate-binding protein [Actinokineospora alba]|uniref:Phospholipid/cholesterol/gamma-HCH transport system substrate-binding protein n=1 Tax=Actinokineospora alba TaxID=504798 RepID=A0A1H0URW7_9PSEU|nr:MlaD family protein [Actinokineospora alba]TDP69100.1 phospholipid/cholesterol/gamma-HCH transport system substrate-binding protein [Actinokineospora alba]SDI79557.1 phospholipid/cholesterol/gamma-HCH transport system substrate-binding protein [Actinokineospora alba]SDP68962.1 phospholipid/cholesterol/gamma-HCH transport system substrate-binding protein [Actinokineospora alba]